MSPVKKESHELAIRIL